MSAPRTKRTFAGAASDPAQRQITAFFSLSSPSSSANADERSSANRGPPLPPTVQSSLLSVGMRIRKSVPEGYKTGSSFGSFSLWSDSKAMPVKTTRSGTEQVPLPTAPVRGGGGGGERRELLPFCGIHSIGGLSSQPPPAEDDLPGLTSSQESVASAPSASASTSLGASGGLSMSATPSYAYAYGLPSGSGSGVTTTSGSRKRYRGSGHCADDDDADADSAVDVPAVLGADRVRVWRHQVPDGEVSPRSLAPAGWGNARVIAAPRRRRGGGGGGDGGEKLPPASSLIGAGGVGVDLLPVPDQENMVVVSGDDFGEADFLDYRSWSPDLEMGGV